MVIYDSSYKYVTSCADLRTRIARIDAIITALEETVLLAATNATVTDYMLDDGQTKISETYRDPAAVAVAINAYERIKERYINKLNGRVFRAVDSKNLNGRYGLL